jgi:hypothetical protein
MSRVSTSCSAALTSRHRPPHVRRAAGCVPVCVRRFRAAHVVGQRACRCPGARSGPALRRERVGARGDRLGLRNAFGLASLRDGRLLALDQGTDDRGIHPINTPDLCVEGARRCLVRLVDFIGGELVTARSAAAGTRPQPTLVLANQDDLPLPKLPLHEVAGRPFGLTEIVPGYLASAAVLVFGSLLTEHAPGEQSERSVTTGSSGGSRWRPPPSRSGAGVSHCRIDTAGSRRLYATSKR